MSAVPTPAPARDPLRRDRAHRVIAGVCAGIARHLCIDPLLLRIAFVAATLAGGIGIPLYLIAWAVIPAEEGEADAGLGQPRPGRARGTARVGAGVALLALSVLLTLRQLDVWSSDALVWPVVLALAGGAIIWRQSVSRPDAAAQAGPPPPPAAMLNTSAAAATAGRAGAAAGEAAAGRAGAWLPRPNPRVLARVAGGVALVLAGAALFLAANNVFASREVALVVGVVLAGAVVILGPWWVRMLRTLTAERTERIRSQERAELAAHLHDSVLQTLALIQKRAGDPRAVAGLARRQERELRAWLSGRPAPEPGTTLAAALEHAAAEVEETLGATIDVVAVGDCPLDGRVEAVVAAAREALVNAAKFAGEQPISVYAEASDDRVEVFVRDRGPGFDPAAVPADRHGVRESIIGRMERHGGRAQIRNDGGTEVHLTMEREP